MINRHPSVRMSLVQPRKSPITGAIVVADVVLREPSGAPDAVRRSSGEILELCRARSGAPQGAGDDPLRAGARRSRRPASWRAPLECT